MKEVHTVPSRSEIENLKYSLDSSHKVPYKIHLMFMLDLSLSYKGSLHPIQLNFKKSNSNGFPHVFFTMINQHRPVMTLINRTAEPHPEPGLPQDVSLPLGVTTCYCLKSPLRLRTSESFTDFMFVFSLEIPVRVSTCDFLARLLTFVKWDPLNPKCFFSQNFIPFRGNFCCNFRSCPKLIAAIRYPGT